MIRRLILTLGLVLVGAVVFASPAHADLCKDAPAPVSPKAGLPGLLTAAPDRIPAAAPDPFADPTVPIGDVYGYSWHWSNYDLGCGSDFLRDPGAVTNTTSGNILLSIAGGMTAALAALEQMAAESSLAWLSVPLGNIAGALRGPILSAWFPVATLALAVLVLWKAKQASYQETAKTLAVFAAAVALAVFSLLYPAALSTQVDKVVTTTARVTGSTFSASATDAVNRESGYRTWLTGSFGDADSTSAKRYGPRLMSATHYTWSDWQRIEANPAAKDSIDEAKAAEFKKIAEGLKADDPAGYEVFTGRGERTGPALFGILNVAAMGLFTGMAALMVLTSRVMMQGLTIVAPLAAVAGILPKWHGALAKLWDLFTAAVIAVAKFTLAGGIMAMVLGAVQAADMSGVGRLFFVVVATVVGLVLTKPVRSLKTIVPGLDPNQSYVKKFYNQVAPALAGGAGSYVGTREGAQDAKQDEPVADAPTSQPASSLAGLPAPAAPAAPTITVTQTPTSATAPQPHHQDPLQAVAAADPVRALPAARPALPTAAVDAEPTEAAPAPTAQVPPTPPPEQPSAAPTDVVHPTAVIVRADPAQYHPGAPPEEYLVPSAELEMAEDGTEHERVVYHAKSS